MLTQKQVLNNRIKLQDKIKKLRDELNTLQSVCLHTNATKKYRGNTGNYDPSENCYWIDFYCPDCDKRWQTEQ